MAGYEDLPGFEHVYLEDSFVLAVHEDDASLRFTVEIVLLRHHPRWRPTKPNEAHTYANADLVFREPRRVWWIARSMRPIKGPDDEIDYGNIDSFSWRTNEYELQGEWGHLKIEANAAPQLVYR